MRKCFWVICLLMLASAGCDRPSPDIDVPRTSKTKSNRVVAVSYALQFLTSRIAGDDLEVEFPMPASADASTWRPTVEDIQRMQTADLVIANGQGVRFAAWVDRVSLKDSKICDSAMALELDDFILVEDHAIVHKHGNEGEHSHPFLVPYIWLDPALAKKQAGKIKERLVEVYPDLAAGFETRFIELASDLDQLGDAIRAIGGAGTAVITLNPNLKFMTRSAKLDDQHLLIFGPDDVEKNVSRLNKLLEKHEAKTLFIPKGFDVGAIETLAKNHNLAIVEVDMLDRQPVAGDYLSAMSENITRLKSAAQQD